MGRNSDPHPDQLKPVSVFSQPRKYILCEVCLFKYTQCEPKVGIRPPGWRSDPGPISDSVSLTLSKGRPSLTSV